VDPAPGSCFDPGCPVTDVESEAVLERRVRELQSALAHQERISRALREVGNALGTTVDLDELLELILAKVTELLEADRSTLYLLDESRGELVSRIVIGQQVRSIRLKVGHGIAGAVAQTGTPIRIENAYADPRFEPEWDTLTGYTTRNMLVAPLKNHLGRTIGVIQVLNKLGDAEFSADDEATLIALSTQAAIAIVNSRLLLSLIHKNKQLLDTTEQLERRVRDLKLLFDLERATARATSVEALARAVLRQLAEACEARGAAMLLGEEESGDLVQYVFDSERAEDLQRLGLKTGEGFLAHAMNDPGLLDIEKSEGDPHWNERVEGAYSFPVQSVLAMPLEGDEAPLGALGLFSKRADRAFTGEDASLLRLVAANVSTAVRLFRASQARERGERLTTIGQLLSQVIHDFKTPMTVISGYVQLMQDADQRTERVDYAEEILKQFDQLTAMQREVLEFARGERSLFVRKVYLRKFFADIVRQLAREVDGRAIELEVDVDTKVVARFDEGRVARAIHNLARNAVEAMAEHGGQLKIFGGMDGDDLVIRVSDTGPGIPKEIEGRLFQSFVTARKEGGTGLGLAIVKKIAEEHGGSVGVHSGPEGATFELRFPQRPGRNKAPSRPPRQKSSGKPAAPREPR
jgi:signal transduction histidine kinase/putative methionine-R-sulfoxide reductase with GAF domain